MGVRPSNPTGPDAEVDETPRQTEAQADPISGLGVLDDAQSLLEELIGLVHDRFKLAALETRRAGESLVAMVVIGVMAGVLLGSAWLGLGAIAVLWLSEHGVVTSSALLLVVSINALFGLILYGMIRRNGRFLLFPATLRSLKANSPNHRDAN